MDSLVGYGSDDENENERYSAHQSTGYGSGTASSRRRDDDTNYDDVNMDMSEGSQSESEPELPQAEPAPPRRPPKEDRRRSDASRERDRDRDRERDRDHERRDKKRESPPRQRSDRRSPLARRDDKHRSDKDRAERTRGHDSGSSKRGLLGDRPEEKSSDKVPALMDLKPFGGEPPPSLGRERAQDARDAVSPSDEGSFSDASVDGHNMPVSSGSESDTDEEAADQSSDDDEEWVDEREQPHLPFTSTPMANVGAAESPFDYFNLFFNLQFMQILVNSINTHAIRVLLESNSENARINRWKNTNVAELNIFLGILFHMGHVKLPRINDYWRRDILCNFSFRRFMSRDRFLLILRNLCFLGNNDIPNSPVGYTKPIIDFFNNLMAALVIPLRNLTIDETLVIWRGRLAFRQYIKGKRHKYGIKLYVLTDSKGTCQKIIMYSGARDPTVGGRGHTDKVVKLLMENYLDKGYALFMDNFYNSVGLAEDLLARGTYCTGTLRARRLRNPPFVNAQGARGSCLFKFNRRGVCVANYFDKRKVLTISTQFSGELVQTTNRRGNLVRKPQMILEYNKNMKGVDYKDQLLAYYSCYPKSMRWYKKIIIHIFQVMILNSHLLYKVENPNISLYNYRLDIVKRLLNISDEATDRQTNGQITTNLRETIHLPSECPKDNRNRTKRRRCALCWRKNQLRKLVLYYCSKCPQQPGLCLSCFREFHNYKD